MSVYFGTDGIRGVAGENLTFELAYKCGVALGEIKKSPKIIIGRDTRLSGNHLLLALSCGATSVGANIVDIGICTTPAISYITKAFNADFGVMISASHNPSRYNGIKIFGSNGKKLPDEIETIIESKFFSTQKPCVFGKYLQNYRITDLYINYIKECVDCPLNGLKVVLDASNGGAYKIAPKIFRDLGAEVIELSCSADGENINNDCGSLHPENLCKKVVEENADMGFAFDGDADRIIACDENGKILDGDILTYIIALQMQEKGRLNKNTVVGTSLTNAGLEKALTEKGITLLRSDVGDKYVMEIMEKEGLNLGGEKSGHIILSDYQATGDGVFCALMIASICKKGKTRLSSLASIDLYPQINIDVPANNKIKIINSPKLQQTIENCKKTLPQGSRILVRPSGTEDVVRIMVESPNESIAISSAKELETLIKDLNLK